ncbi:MAG: tRNA 2-thiocytidine(32) synthetase TtcA [Desulfobacteraceae bacterium]|nr:tRNA 2-thiocytidine(32) synthetase TtcA [Desulfobacteraceae bacterium]MBU4002198.1 tRNA 2-thiocytidine(32) synthetase TtcA [Pseudomonadota bacterium]MBU4053468.1 tRNA 2-thiocytidine(32) synthetase TtcA [Pseudomonadota bacterium]
MGRAIHHYDMISHGDRILVALSGGKDSMTLLWMLHERLSRIQVRYELFPVHVNPGFDDQAHFPLKEYCEERGIPLRVEKTNFGLLAHGDENRKNPCFLCSWLRRKRLFEIADEMKCNKIALGHNKDDIIETLFINIFYSGEISTMLPSQVFFKGLFTLIRPLAYVDEWLTRKFTLEQGFPEIINICPSASFSKRGEIKEMLNGLYQTNTKIKGNIFRAMRHVNTAYLLK